MILTSENKKQFLQGIMFMKKLIHINNKYFNWEFNIQIVGGAVRDLIMENKIYDLDFNTNLSASELFTLLKRTNYKYFLKDEKYQTIVVIVASNHYEVTPYRKDIKPDGRQTNIEYVKCLETDLSRRDFTFNGMCINHKIQIFDMFNGLKHIREKNVQFIGNFISRIKEDQLRVYRYIRFMVLVNDPRINAKMYQINVQSFHNSKKISVERRLEEQNKCIKYLLDKPFSVFIKYLMGLIVNQYFLIQIKLRITDYQLLYKIKPIYFIYHIFDLANKDLLYMNYYKIEREYKNEFKEHIIIKNYALRFKRKIDKLTAIYAIVSDAVMKNYNNYIAGIYPWYDGLWKLTRRIDRRINNKKIFQENDLYKAKYIKRKMMLKILILNS